MVLPKIQFGLVCEDVRREDNGKLLLIGVFGRNIGIPVLPATLVFCLVVAAQFDEPGEVATKVRLQLNGNTVLEGNGKMRAKETGKQLFPLRNLVLETEKDGELSFQLQFEDGDWQTVCEIPLQLQKTG